MEKSRAQISEASSRLERETDRLIYILDLATASEYTQSPSPSLSDCDLTRVQRILEQKWFRRSTAFSVSTGFGSKDVPTYAQMQVVTYLAS